MTFVAVLPVLAEDLTARCLGSMAPRLLEHLVLIDNTGTGNLAAAYEASVAYSLAPDHNLGVPASWNVGLRFAEHEQADYLLIVSQSIRFGRRGGTDFLWELERRQPSMFLDAPQLGWKLIAVRRERFAEVGPFDEIFTPGYYEESDWMYRAHLAGLCSPWYNVRSGREQVLGVDAISAGDGVALTRKLVTIEMGEQTAKYVAKFGGRPREERFIHPYNDPDLDWRFVGQRTMAE